MCYHHKGDCRLQTPRVPRRHPSSDQTGGWLALITELLFLQSSHILRSLSFLSSQCWVRPLVLFLFSFFIFSFSHLFLPQQGPLILPSSSKTSSPPDTADRQIIKHNRFCLEFVSLSFIPTPPPLLPFQKLSTTQDLIVRLLIYISKRYIVLPEFFKNLRATLGITGREVPEKDRGCGWLRVPQPGLEWGGALFLIVMEESSNLN